MKQHQTNRNRAYYRHHRKRVIRRKVRIAEQYGWNISFEGRFAKGKIHCSCLLCAIKTKKDGFPHSQKKKLQCLDYQWDDYVKDELL